MEGGRVYGGSDMITLLDNSSNSLWLPSSSPSFHETMVNFDQEIQRGIRSSPVGDRHRTTSEGDGEDEYDTNMNPFKKRRLTPEQVQYLEKNFEVENKLEPERKVQLAKELGLQPRQVAIWFQNRRARYKTKQLEKDYDLLKASYDSLKADYDSLINDRDNLQNEVRLLTKKLKQRDIDWATPNPKSPNNPLNLDPHLEVELEKGSKMVAPPSMYMKQAEDASSAKSDVFDSESPHCTEGIHSSRMEDPGDSTHLRDPDLHSDNSQDHEEDKELMMSKALLLPTYSNNGLKVEEGFYDINNVTATCNFSFVDDQPSWSWLI